MDAILDPLLTFYRECLEEQQRLSAIQEGQRVALTELTKYQRRRTENLERDNDLLNDRLTSLEAVVTRLLTTGHPTTREETAIEMREEAHQAPDSDYLWQILLEADTDEDDGMFTNEQMTTLDAMFE